MRRCERYPSLKAKAAGTVCANGIIAKGYGFIAPDTGGKDVFVHISAVERASLRGLSKGQKVSYELMIDGRSGKESASDLRAE